MPAAGVPAATGAGGGRAGLVWLPIAVLTILVLAACGGSGGSGAQRFASRANAICARSGAQARTITVASNDLGAVGAYAGELLPIARRMVSGLEGLTPPAAKRQAYRRYVAILRSDVSDLVRLQAQAKVGNAVQVGQLASAIASRGGAPQARSLGLAKCAVPVISPRT